MRLWSVALRGHARLRFWRQADRRALFRAEAQSNARFLIKWLALAYAIETLLVFYMPAEFIAGLVSGKIDADCTRRFGWHACLFKQLRRPSNSCRIDGPSAGATMSFILAGL